MHTKHFIKSQIFHVLYQDSILVSKIKRYVYNFGVIVSKTKNGTDCLLQTLPITSLDPRHKTQSTKEPMLGKYPGGATV